MEQEGGKSGNRITHANRTEQSQRVTAKHKKAGKSSRKQTNKNNIGWEGDKNQKKKINRPITTQDITHTVAESKKALIKNTFIPAKIEPHKTNHVQKQERECKYAERQAIKANRASKRRQ